MSDAAARVTIPDTPPDEHMHSPGAWADGWEARRIGKPEMCPPYRVSRHRAAWHAGYAACAVAMEAKVRGGMTDETPGECCAEIVRLRRALGDIAAAEPRWNGGEAPETYLERFIKGLRKIACQALNKGNQQ